MCPLTIKLPNSSHLIRIVKGSALLCDGSIGFKQSTTEFRELEGASLVSLVEMIKEKKKLRDYSTLQQPPVVCFQANYFWLILKNSVLQKAQIYYNNCYKQNYCLCLMWCSTLRFPVFHKCTDGMDWQNTALKSHRLSALTLILLLINGFVS